MADHLETIWSRGRATVKAELREASTRIHLSFDLWTSPNIYAFMAVTSHFLDSKGKHQSRLLAFTQQQGNHSGVNLATTLEDTVRDWGLVSRMGVVICDNATNNDTCLASFYPRINPRMTSRDCKAHRMRCYGHILNLVAKSLLFGSDFETFEAESEFYQTVHRDEEDLKLWRKTGPVGKLRNIVRFIRASPQRSERFKKVAKEVDGGSDYCLFNRSSSELQLILNNDTRWNSTYLMIERAVEKRHEIRAYLSGLNDDEESLQIPISDHLTDEDWLVLVEVKSLLEPLFFQTKRTEGWGKGDGHGRLWEVITGMEYILEHLEEWKNYYNHEIAPIVVQEDEEDEEEEDRQLPTRNSRSLRSSARRSFNESSLPDHVEVDWARRRAEATSQFRRLRKGCQVNLRTSIELAWQKLNKYYSALAESPLFAASIILHPYFGFNYLKEVWGRDGQEAWVRSAEKGLERFFNKWYKDDDVSVVSLASSSASSLAPSSQEDSHFRQWLRSRRSQEARATSDELHSYLRQAPEETDDPARWWLDRQAQYPRLSKLALDVFAIPAMASDCERAFSAAKLTLTSQRLSMKAESIERLQLTKNWLKRGVLPMSGIDGFVVHP